MKKGFFQMLAIVIFTLFLLAGFSCSSSKTPESSKAKHSKKAETSPTSGSLARKESGHKISDLDGQSTRKDEGTLARPDGNRTIKGLDGLDIHSNSESQ